MYSIEFNSGCRCRSISIIFIFAFRKSCSCRLSVIQVILSKFRCKELNWPTLEIVLNKKFASGHRSLQTK